MIYINILQNRNQKSSSCLYRPTAHIYVKHFCGAIKLSVKYGNEWLRQVSAQDLNGDEKQIFFFCIVILLRE